MVGLPSGLMINGPTADVATATCLLQDLFALCSCELRSLTFFTAQKNFSIALVMKRAQQCGELANIGENLI
jgi:hypothetical protein